MKELIIFYAVAESVDELAQALGVIKHLLLNGYVSGEVSGYNTIWKIIEGEEEE